MRTKQYTTHVKLPGNLSFEVTYYCKDARLTASEKQTHTQLYIQFHDCICTLKIEKDICKKPHLLENIVHTKVINTKGHLC